MNCLNPGPRHLSTTIVCTIKGILIGGIRLLRPNGRSPQVVIQCNPPNNQCLSMGNIHGYRGVPKSSIQTTIIIDSFDSTLDAGLWRCQDGAGGIPSSCVKKTASKLII